MSGQEKADSPKLGRRSGPSTTRDEVLRAAQKRFARDGFDGTSIRKVAGDAGVDPALVMQFFKSKDGLFAASLILSDEVQDRITAAFDGPHDRLGQNLTEAFLNLWEDSEDRPPLMAALRGAASNTYAAEQLGQFVQNRLVDVIGPKVGNGPEAARRAGLVLSMLMGLVLTRNMVIVPLTAELSRAEVAKIIAPSIQVLLDGA
ncbi:TetR/AcrR family transcriptional regulator [Marivivens aquimaris]|uniref:TetR/AcrR family transcriptional regulator n=1 Tax=Marivivens aquimaris TaxID=2774876 RepID=UPI00187DF1FA|nr:TetR family transcriptional regulator [Marivivens aquimaris]